LADRTNGRVSRSLILAALCGASLLDSHPCRASAFALREQSATALGNAFAGGSAAAEDPSYMFFNPAALARQDGTQVLSVASYIRPTTKFNVKDADTAAGVPIGGGNGGDDVADDHVLPALYAVVDLRRHVDVVDNLTIGLAVTAPFGLETDYDSGWAGRYHALQSKLATVNLSPTVAFDLFEGLSIGVGLQAQYVDAELSNAVDFGSIGAASPPLAPIAEPTRQDGKARIKGDDWGFGWTAGILYQPRDGTRLGVGYRSHVHHELDGDARFRLDRAGIGTAVAAATGRFTDTGAKATLETPETVTFGLYQKIDDRWSVVADAAWTRWSRIDELRVRFDNPNQPDSVTDSDWRDTWFFAAGVTYRPAEPWALRFGAAYDESPVPNRTRTPRVPDNDRYWLTVGASYRPSTHVDLSVGYAHIFGNDASVNLAADDPGNLSRGDLSGDVDASVDIVGVQVRLTF
jgi:long-chain fatty acid transport protein